MNDDWKSKKGYISEESWQNSFPNIVWSITSPTSLYEDASLNLEKASQYWTSYHNTSNHLIFIYFFFSQKTVTDTCWPVVVPSAGTLPLITASGSILIPIWAQLDVFPSVGMFGLNKPPWTAATLWSWNRKIVLIFKEQGISRPLHTAFNVLLNTSSTSIRNTSYESIDESLPLPKFSRIISRSKVSLSSHFPKTLFHTCATRNIALGLSFAMYPR